MSVLTSAGTKQTDGPSGLAHGMRAFRHSNFKRVWFGALVSNSGTWLQNITVPYVLLEITGAARWVGIAAFAGIFPVVILGPLAGNLADRFDRRKVIIVGQVAAALATGALWLAWVQGVRDPYAVVGLAALSGIIGGFTLPTWQSFVPTLVPASDLQSAISLNSLQFNAARAMGPAVGGALIAAFGPAWAFGLNALSFGAVLVALLAIDSGQTSQVIERRPLVSGFVDALAYIRHQPGIMVSMAMASIVAFLGFPLVGFVVIYAKQVYQVDAGMLGVLSALLGVGSVLAVPVAAGVFGDFTRAGTIRFTLPLYGLAIMVFGYSTKVWMGAFGLLFSGMGFLILVVASNTAVQTIVADRIRGRVMAVRIMTFTGAYPLGSLIQTRLADSFGPRPVVVAAGAAVVALGLVFLLRPSLAAHLDDPPDEG